MPSIDPLIAEILYEHTVQVGMASLSLLSSTRQVAELAGVPAGQLSDALLSLPLYQLSEKDVLALRQAIAGAHNEEVVNALNVLLVMQQDLHSLQTKGISYLTFWRHKEGEWRREDEGNEEGVSARISIGSTTKGLLECALQNIPRKFCLTELREYLGSKVFDADGALFFQLYIALPVARVFLGAVNDGMTRFTVTTGREVPCAVRYAPHAAFYLLYSAVRATCRDGEQNALGAALGEAVVSSLPLTPQTAYATVVMAVVGTKVRIGLLTQWKGLDEFVVKDLPQGLKDALTRAGVKYLSEDDRGASEGLLIQHTIEFCALTVEPRTFEGALGHYFYCITREIRKAIETPLRIKEEGGGARSCFMVPKNLRPTGRKGNIVVRTYDSIDTGRLRSIHEKVGQPINVCGVFTTKYSEEQHTYTCCIYDHVPDAAYERNDPDDFTRVCLAVIHLHDTLHVCHGDIRRGNVIIDYVQGTATFVNYKCAVDSVDTKPDANIPSVKALRTFLASMEPSHREYVEADHWLFHRLADVLAVFQRVWFNQGGSDFNAQEYQGFLEILKRVISGHIDQSEPSPPARRSRPESPPSASILTKELMDSILAQCNENHVLQGWVATLQSLSLSK